MSHRKMSRGARRALLARFTRRRGFDPGAVYWGRVDGRLSAGWCR